MQPSSPHLPLEVLEARTRWKKESGLLTWYCVKNGRRLLWSGITTHPLFKNLFTSYSVARIVLSMEDLGGRIDGLSALEGHGGGNPEI